MLVAVASALVLALAAILAGFAIAGTAGAARGLVFASALLMLGAAATVLLRAARTKHSDEDSTVVLGYAVLRGGAGVSAIWLALGGGAACAWTLVAFVVAYPVWMSAMRRRRGIT